MRAGSSALHTQHGPDDPSAGSQYVRPHEGLYGLGRPRSEQLDDAAVIAIIEKMLKQRKDSITQYEAGKRQDLANAEKFEVEVLSAYMPQPLSSAEVAAIVAAAVELTGASAPADMGRVIALVKPQVAGRADMGEVSRLVKAKLSCN